MKKIIIILLLISVLNSCAMNLELSAYDFDNFKETPVWELAQAVRADDAIKIKEILKEKNLEIDFKDPEYKQTLLALSIQNQKKNAFLELLNEGANPNELVGNPKDATPFIYAIWNVEKCNLFYVENMLQHGANPNLEIKNPRPSHYFADSFPLISSINVDKNCLNLVKLLVDNGADINSCYKQGYVKSCDGVIDECLISHNMKALKYFVIEKQIKIPDTLSTVARNENGQRVYRLKEILRTKDFELIDFEDKKLGIKVDKHQDRAYRDEILEYLDKFSK